MTVLRWEWLLVALIAPLLAFPPLGRPLLWIALLLPAMWIVAACRGLEALPATPLNGSILVLLCAVLLSLTVIFDLFYAAPKILGVVLGVAVYFAIVRRLDDAIAIDRALDLFVLAGVALAALGLLGTAWFVKVPVIGKITAHLPAVIRGVPGQTEGFHPNAIAGALLFFLPLQFAIAALASARIRRFAAIAALLFTSGVFLLTQSRNAWLSLAIAAAAWAAWHFSRARRIVIAATVAALIAGAVIASLARTTAERTVAGGVPDDVAGRLELWSRGIAIVRDFPFTGIGMNGFRRVMPKMYPALLTPSDVDVAHVHNHLLQAALDLGIPGLVAYLALWLGVAAMIATMLRASRDRRTQLIAGAFGAAFLASFGFGTADVIPLGSKVGIAFWIALALVAALHRQTMQELAA